MKASKKTQLVNTLLSNGFNKSEFKVVKNDLILNTLDNRAFVALRISKSFDAFLVNENYVYGFGSLVEALKITGDTTNYLNVEIK